jgi:hypothetical protein
MLSTVQQSGDSETSPEAKRMWKDITLKLQCDDDGEAPVRAAHRFMLAARSTPSSLLWL